jgi:hypothetical protein
VKVVLDAGALIALERADRALWRRYKAAQLQGVTMVTHGGIVGQVWRAGGARQARLALALRGIEVRPLGDELGRAAGKLLAAARGSDVVDAALVLLADDDDEILTSDPDDLEPLAAATGKHVDLITV